MCVGWGGPEVVDYPAHPRESCLGIVIVTHYSISMIIVIIFTYFNGHNQESQIPSICDTFGPIRLILLVDTKTMSISHWLMGGEAGNPLDVGPDGEWLDWLKRRLTA